MYCILIIMSLRPPMMLSMRMEPGITDQGTCDEGTNQIDNESNENNHDDIQSLIQDHYPNMIDSWTCQSNTCGACLPNSPF